MIDRFLQDEHLLPWTIEGRLFDHVLRRLHLAGVDNVGGVGGIGGVDVGNCVLFLRNIFHDLQLIQSHQAGVGIDQRQVQAVDLFFIGLEQR